MYLQFTNKYGLIFLTRLSLIVERRKRANEISKGQGSKDVCLALFSSVFLCPLQIVFPFKVLTELGISALAANNH